LVHSLLIETELERCLSPVMVDGNYSKDLVESFDIVFFASQPELDLIERRLAHINKSKSFFFLDIVDHISNLRCNIKMWSLSSLRRK